MINNDKQWEIQSYSVFERKINEPFNLENSSSLTKQVTYNSFQNEIKKKIFFKNCLIKIHVSNLMEFLNEMAHLFFLPK